MEVTIYLCSVMLILPLWNIAISLDQIQKEIKLKREKEINP